MSLIISLTLLLSTLFSHIYWNSWYKSYERFDGESKITGEVINYEQGEYSDRFYIKTDKINGEAFSRYTLILDIPRDERGALRPGCRIELTGFLGGFESSEDFDAKSYYFSDGINGEIESYSDLKITEYGEPSLSYSFLQMRESIQRQAILYSDKDSGTLLTALLLGERDALSNSVKLDFTRLGITHILALSGMHLTILTMGIGALLSLLRIGKKTRTVLLTAFSFLYVAFTGFSVSVVRAGVMLVLSSLLYLLKRGYDSITSLTVAVFVICTVTPYAIYDTALWLSAFATLGVIIMSEYSATLSKPKSIIVRAFRRFVISILASVFAIAMTLPTTVNKFYGISAVAPLATIIFSVLCELIMYYGTVVLLLGGLIPFIGKPLIWLCDLTELLAKLLSDSNYAYTSTNHTLIIVTSFILFAAFLLFLVLDIKRKNVAVLIISLLFCAVTGEALYYSYSDTATDLAVYFADEKTDSFLIRSEGDCIYVSSATYSKNIAYGDISRLNEYGVTRIDKYILTHYAYGISDSIGVLSKNYLIKEIYLPSPRNDDEEQILKKLRSSISDIRCEIVLYDLYEPIDAGNASIKLLYSTAYGEDSSSNAIFLKMDDVYCTYLSSGILELDEELTFGVRNYMTVSDSHIYGVHGKKYKKKHFMTAKEYSLDNIILNKVYLTPELLEEYEKDGCEIIANPSKVELYRN